jgi:hypothetical protein
VGGELVRPHRPRTVPRSDPGATAWRSWFR